MYRLCHPVHNNRPLPCAPGHRRSSEAFHENREGQLCTSETRTEKCVGTLEYFVRLYVLYTFYWITRSSKSYISDAAVCVMARISTDAESRRCHSNHRSALSTRIASKTIANPQCCVPTISENALPTQCCQDRCWTRNPSVFCFKIYKVCWHDYIEFLMHPEFLEPVASK